MRATAFSKIKWLRMRQVVDCEKSKLNNFTCKCADNLRRKHLIFGSEKLIEREIKNAEMRYFNCNKENQSLY